MPPTRESNHGKVEPGKESHEIQRWRDRAPHRTLEETGTGQNHKAMRTHKNYKEIFERIYTIWMNFVQLTLLKGRR